MVAAQDGRFLGLTKSGPRMVLLMGELEERDGQNFHVLELNEIATGFA